MRIEATGKDLSRVVDDTFKGLLTGTKVPSGIGVGQGLIYLNPVSATTDFTLLGLAIGGSRIFRVSQAGVLDGTGTRIQTQDGNLFGDASGSFGFQPASTPVDFQTQVANGSTQFRIFANQNTGGTAAFSQLILNSYSKGQASMVQHGITLINQSSAWWFQLGSLQAGHIDLVTLAGSQVRIREALVLASQNSLSDDANWMGVRLTNQTGALSVVGDIIGIRSVTSDDSYVLTTRADLVRGIVVEAVANATVGNIAIAGIALVKVNGTVARGDIIVASKTTAGEGLVSGLPQAGDCIIGKALTTKGAGVGTVRCILGIEFREGVRTLRTTGDQTINGTAYQDITGLTFPVEANKNYAFRFHIIFTEVNTTTGFRFAVNGPAGGTVEYLVHYQTIANATVGADVTVRKDTAYDAMAALTSSVAAGVQLLCTIEGTLRNGGTAGTLAARVASELANNDLVIQGGSWGIWF